LKRIPEAGWRGILADAQRMIDVAWGNDVWGPFHDTLNGKYPFQAGGPDAPLAEFTRFFGPEGVFWHFYDADLAPFLDREGNPKVLFRYGLRIGPEGKAAIGKAHDFRRALFTSEAEAGKMGFTFRVKPAQTIKVSGQAPYVRTSRLSVGETRIVYDMGLAKETKVAWPGPQGVENASLAVTMEGNAPGELGFEGPWAFFRLLDKGTFTTKTDTECEVRFRLERPGEYAVDVPYEIRGSTVPHPFRAGFFEFNCPRELGQGAGTTPAPAAAPETPPVAGA
jgi:type VI secretion system protein ImpL